MGEYDKLCVECGWDKESGVDCLTFELLINTQECNFYSTDELLEQLATELKADGKISDGGKSMNNSTRSQSVSQRSEESKISKERGNAKKKVKGVKTQEQS